MWGIGVWGDRARRDVFFVRAVLHGFKDLVSEEVKLLGGGGVELLRDREKGQGSLGMEAGLGHDEEKVGGEQGKCIQMGLKNAYVRGRRGPV